MLVLLAISDYKYKIIPNKITFPCMIIGLCINGIPNIWSIIIVVILMLMGGFYILPMGDVKMYMALCFFVSPYTFLLVFLFSQILIIAFHFTKRKKEALKEVKTSTYPLAPFVLMGYIVVLLLQFGGVLHC